MVATDQDFEITQGTPQLVNWTVTSGGSPVDLSSKTFRLRAVHSKNDPISSALIIRTDEFTVTGVGDNIINLPFVPSDTVGLGTVGEGSRRIFYDLRYLTDDIVVASGHITIPPSPSR